MALRSGLALYFYTPQVNAASTVLREYASEIESLRVTSTIPGGYGSLSAVLKIDDARVPRPELGIFSRVILKDGPDTLWMGEVSDPRIGLQTGQEYIRISALGLGNCLRDQQRQASYSNQTVQQVARAELAAWLARVPDLPFDSDNTLLFADNPAGSFTFAWDQATPEDIINLLVTVASTATTQYTWYGIAHALGAQPVSSHVDVYHFPTLQLVMQARDLTTIHYQASVSQDEITAYEIAPSMERAYNFFRILYNNAASSVGTITTKDTRLAANNTQGSAPFRYRELTKDFSSNTLVNSAMAANIANSYLAQYQSVTNKVSLTLRGVRDGTTGKPLDLWRVMAGAATGRNIAVPETAIRSLTALPLVPTKGTSLFAIVSATYTEGGNGNVSLQLECDNYADSTNDQVTRLTLAQEAVSRSRKLTAVVQVPGAPIYVQGACSGVATAAGQAIVGNITFEPQAANVPSSLTVDSTLQNVNANAGAFSAFNFTTVGCTAQVTSVAAGSAIYAFSAHTNGNTLLAVAARRGTLDWHCEGCEARHARAHGCGVASGCADCRERATHRGLTLRTHLAIHRGYARCHPITGVPERDTATGAVARDDTPGRTGLAICCPACAAQGQTHIQAFNTALNGGDAAQNRLIAALMRHRAVRLPLPEHAVGWADEERVTARQAMRATAEATAGATRRSTRRTA